MVRSRIKEQSWKKINSFLMKLILLVSYFTETINALLTRNVSIPNLIFSCADIHFKGTKAELMWKDPDTRSQTVTTAGTFSFYVCMHIYSHKQS